MLVRQIAATNESIDKLVYELPPSGMIPPSGTILPSGTMYGLMREEIRIVEGRGRLKCVALGFYVLRFIFS